MDSEHPSKQPLAGANPGRQHSIGTVVAYPGDARNPCSHECITHAAVAQRAAAILGYQFAGAFDPSNRHDSHLYFVPSDTLIVAEAAQRLGIHGEQDLFGGVVPFPFVATKTITHPLLSADATGPAGWSRDFCDRVRDVVLPGFSAFTMQDAFNAGRRMLTEGAVRIKIAGGIGGLGQSVVANAAELEEQLGALDVEEVLRDGLVLECNLEQVSTRSVGQVRIGALTASYYGEQHLTRNNSGAQVYGGSDLIVARGDFDALLRLELADPVRLAIAQARKYHAAALTSFPGMFASRCNYDIAQGLDNEGRWRSGVLEQSWRIGGASGAEIAALEAFQADPGLAVVCASTIEVYGAAPQLPEDAVLYFSGTDACVGPLTKYSVLKLNAYP